MSKALDTVNRFYDITNHRKGQGLAEVVTEDVAFEGPLLTAHGKQQYVAMNEQFLGFHRGTRMLRQFEHGDEVCSIYEMEMATPVGGKMVLEMVDWILVRGGKVAKQKIFYDPRAFAQAFGMA